MKQFRNTLIYRYAAKHNFIKTIKEGKKGTPYNIRTSVWKGKRANNIRPFFKTLIFLNRVSVVNKWIRIQLKPNSSPFFPQQSFSFLLPLLSPFAWNTDKQRFWRVVVVEYLKGWKRLLPPLFPIFIHYVSNYHRKKGAYVWRILLLLLKKDKELPDNTCLSLEEFNCMMLWILPHDIPVSPAWNLGFSLMKL